MSTTSWIDLEMARSSTGTEIVMRWVRVMHRHLLWSTKNGRRHWWRWSSFSMIHRPKWNRMTRHILQKRKSHFRFSIRSLTGWSIDILLTGAYVASELNIRQRKKVDCRGYRRNQPNWLILIRLVMHSARLIILIVVERSEVLIQSQ